ncbi:MAG: hypothetical protein ACOC1O_00515 [bacterium]
MYFSKEKKMQQEEQILRNWEWLTEGIEGEENKLNTALVLQNSYEHMVNEGQLGEGWIESLLNEEEQLNEAPTRSGAVGNNLIPKVLFPIIRRVMPSLIANELVSVQPIQARTGVIYHISYQFTDSKGNVTAGDEYSGAAQTAKQGPGYATFYSSEKIGPFTGTVANEGGNTTITTAKAADFLGTDPTQFTLKRIEVYNQSTGQSYPAVLSANTDGTFSGDTTVSYDADPGAVVLLNAANAPWAAGDKVVVYIVYDQEGSSKIPEMEFTMGSQTIDTTERKLKVRWTKEAEQDMNAYHKIDVESELVKVASMEMNYEIDRELLTFISDIAPAELSSVHDWKADAPGTGNNTSGNYLDRHRALAQKLYLSAARIAQYNRQGPASWMVVSPQVGALVTMLPNFKGELSNGTFNVFNAGQLGTGMKVYVDPNRTGDQSGEILLGYKSQNTTYGAGAVYAPYTNWMSNTVTHPDNFNSIRGFFSRYAITEVERGRYFYGKVNLMNAELG